MRPKPLLSTLLAVPLVPMACAAALAQEIPEYDSEASCNRIGGGDRRVAACLRVEEYALDELETFWPRASAAIREECIEATAEEESYALLAACVLGRLRRERERGS
jgi:hypothetical protein